jgi:hypothetical protein
MSLVFTGSLTGMVFHFSDSHGYFLWPVSGIAALVLAKQKRGICLPGQLNHKIRRWNPDQYHKPALLRFSRTLLRKSEKISNFEFIEGMRRINDITASTILIDSILHL